MTPDKKSISELFDKREQYLIPLFQRGYVWALEKQIALLWEDIIEQTEALADYRANSQKVGSDQLRKLRKHFLGAIRVTVIFDCFERNCRPALLSRTFRTDVQNAAALPTRY